MCLPRRGLETGELLCIALAVVVCAVLVSCTPRHYLCHLVSGDYRLVTNGSEVQGSYFRRAGAVDVKMRVTSTKPNAWNTGNVHEVSLYLTLTNESFDSLSYPLGQIEISSAAGAYKPHFVWVQRKRRDEHFNCQIRRGESVKIEFVSRLEEAQRLPDSVAVKLGSIVVEPSGELIPLGDAMFRPTLE